MEHRLTVTMHRNPTPPDVAPHPEAVENRHRGAKLFVGVRKPFLDQDTVTLAPTRRETVEVVLQQGGFTHWYAPFVHTEMPGELAKLRTADASQVLEFARTYGLLGFSQLVGRTEDLRNAFHVDRVTGERSQGGDPLPWIQAHASGVYVCLVLTEALASRVSKAAFKKLLDGLNKVPYGDGADIFRVQIDWNSRFWGQSPEDMARHVRRSIINPHLRGIYRYVTYDGKDKKERSFFGFHAVVNVVYWHLANVLDGGVVKRCEADHCDGIFIQDDPRQRFCPKRFRQRESLCAARQRQRKFRLPRSVRGQHTSSRGR